MNSAFQFYDDPSNPGNVIAFDAQLGEGYAAVLETPNSDVAWVGLAPKVFGAEIAEATARTRHPRLFERLDGDPQQSMRPVRTS